VDETMVYIAQTFGLQASAIFGLDTWSHV
jgi:hypothetical protein